MTQLEYASPPKPASAALARRVGLVALIAYGVGDMIGSGIYGTIGKAAGLMGNALWMGFVVSLLAALLTGFSYASLASRYPRAAGAAYVTHVAFRSRFLSYMIGLAVTASGLTSMATASNVFAKGLSEMLSAPPFLILAAFILLVTAINFIGIRESLAVNIVCTLVEVGGLLFIVAIGLRYWGSVNYLETPPSIGMSSVQFPVMLLSGAVLTFYSFVGFEDMINVSEEVKNPRRNMPIGIIVALLFTTVIYIAVSITAISVVSWRQLPDESNGMPLVQITRVASAWLPDWVFAVISLFAVANTALINYIMGSRLVYGMARHGLLPHWLSHVHSKRKTPWAAILTLMVILAGLASIGNISALASATSLLLLISFMIVNASLVVMKWRKEPKPEGAFDIPILFPCLGVLICAALVAARLYTSFRPQATTEDYIAPVVAIGLLVFIAILYAIMRPKDVLDYGDDD